MSINVNNNNTVILFILNTAIPIIIYNEGNIVAISILFNTFIYNNINMDNEIVIIFILKIVIPVVNVLTKSYKCKIVILSIIITVINSVLTILLKNYKYKTVKIIIIINIFLIDNNIVILFTLNFNLKVVVVSSLKKCK